MKKPIAFYPSKNTGGLRGAPIFILSVFVVLLLILFISKINAAESTTKIVDANIEKNYNQQTKTLIIKDSEDNSELLKAKLDSELNVQVGLGYQKVAQISTTKDFLKYFKKFDFYDIKNKKDTSRQIDFKYLKEVTKEEYNYTCPETVAENGTSVISGPCQKEIIGEYTTQEWVDINLKDIESLPDNFVLGLFTNVKKGDHIEWIPSLLVKNKLIEVKEWAEWTANLNVDLIAYWGFESGSGGIYSDTINNIHDIRMASEKMGMWTIDGKVGNGAYFNGNSSMGVEGPIMNHNQEQFTVVGWYDISSAKEYRLDAAFVVGYNNGFEVLYLPDDTWACLVNSNVYAESSPVSTDVYHHVACVFDQMNNNVSIYIDGEYNASAEMPTGSSTSSYNFWIGDRGDGAWHYYGAIDELGVWDRSLNSEEITELYNNGIGMNYLDNRPQMILNSPSKNQVLSTNSVTFSVTPTVYSASYPDFLDVSIYSNLGGQWGIIASNITAWNNTANEFTVSDIPDGTYIWNALITDNNGERFAPENFTFTISSSSQSNRILNKTNEDISASDNSSENSVSLMTLKVLADTNYTFRCDLVGISDSSTVGIRLNITTPESPNYFRASIVNPTTNSAALFVACSGTDNWCSASGTAAASTVPIPITIDGRLLNGPNEGVIDIRLGSEIEDTPVTIMRESTCWIIEEN